MSIIYTVSPPFVFCCLLLHYLALLCFRSFTSPRPVNHALPSIALLFLSEIGSQPNASPIHLYSTAPARHLLLGISSCFFNYIFFPSFSVPSPFTILPSLPVFLPSLCLIPFLCPLTGTGWTCFIASRTSMSCWDSSHKDNVQNSSYFQRKQGKEATFFPVSRSGLNSGVWPTRRIVSSIPTNNIKGRK